MNLLKESDLELVDIPKAEYFLNYLKTTLGRAEEASQIDDTDNIAELSLGGVPSYPDGIYLSGRDPLNEIHEPTVESILYDIETANSVSGIVDNAASPAIKATFSSIQNPKYCKPMFSCMKVILD